MEYRRQVAMRCDGEDFVIALQPEDEVVFRTKDARALRNLCRRLRWQIAIDTTLSTDDWTWRRKAAVAHVLLPSARKRAPLFWHR
jgi:hypothetical protein